MSSRTLMVLTLLALAGVAAFAYMSGGKTSRRIAAAPAPAEKIVKAQPGPAAPAASPAPAPAAHDAPATTATAAAGPADISKYIGKKFTVGARNLKKVALTFDDGPYPQTTPQVLEILKREGIHATFFMLGQSVRNYPDMARAVAEAGHEIGCHTDSHVNLKGKSSEVVRHEIADTAAYIEKVTGKKPDVFRPPYGTYNATVLKTCADAGMVMVTWSVDPDDWRKGSTATTIAAAILKQTTNGAVILMHDTHEKTIQALPAVIKELRAKGYQFVTVEDLITETANQPAALIAGAADPEPAPARPVSIPLSKSGL